MLGTFSARRFSTGFRHNSDAQPKPAPAVPLELALAGGRCLRFDSTMDGRADALIRAVRCGMIGPGTGVRVYLACGVTDMRKGIAGLAALTQDVLRQKPTGGAVFAFRGRRGDRLKLTLLGWPRVLPVLQSSGTGPISLAKCQRWCLCG